MEQYTYIVNIQRHSNVGGIQAVSKTTTRNTTSTWIDLRVILRNVEQMYFSPRADGEAPCEGTNSPRLFTPGETKVLAKSKVHQLSRAWVTNDGWSSSLI